MTVVVTGANGHVGANLVRTLLARGKDVRALVHLNGSALRNLDIEIIHGDVRDTESLFKAFTGAEMVYHLAACISITMGGWPKLEAINVTGTRNVVDSCLRAGVKRLVHFSSIHAIDAASNENTIDETCSLADLCRCPPYDRSKAGGERVIYAGIRRDLEAIIISPTAVIGPHDYQPSHFGEVLLTLARGKLPALVRGGYDWVDVRDVVDGAIAAGETAAVGTKYLLSGHWISLPDVAAAVSELTAARIPRWTCPMWLAEAGAPAVTAFNRITGKRPLFTRVALRAIKSNHKISHDKATRDLGYSPRPFHETIRDTLLWFQENGQLAGPVRQRAKELV